MTQIRKCIIPAAGFGTRFLPATKAQPKEMLPIVDKPVIQYLVEEAVAAGITDIIIVTGRGKRSIEDHFDVSYELEQTLVEKGKIKELAEVEKVSHLARIAYVRQPIPRGDGDALLRAHALIGDEPCLVLFGDDLIKGERGGAEQLIEAFAKYKSPIIAVERVTDKRVSSYGIIESAKSEGTLHTVAKFLEKPKPSETQSRLGVIGKYIITPEVFDYLEQGGSLASKDGEIRLADAFERMVRDGKKVYGLEMEGDRYDTGDKFGFLKANIDYALDREDLRPQLIEFLKKKVSEL
ncbi:UTP--glucose-1-phosphate uridylyltransferase [Candidatus Gracilibacteria bacterium]|nr:UTP--glucose-1-phosphate uridylyltransferase [Candidatus Gracilibacteria bacterium]